MAYPREEIPDGDDLYMRIHYKTIREGKPFAGVFKNHGRGMSTNWSKYSDANATRIQGTQNSGAYGVLSMRVGDVRTIPEQVVVHSPEPSNRAHTDVEGKKDVENRLKYYNIHSMVIQPDMA